MDNLELLEEELKIRKARKDINSFCEYVMRDTSTGENFKQAKIHRELQAMIDLYERVVILLPRDCGKTSQILARVLFELGRNRNHKIKIVCATGSLAKKRILELRTHIEKNDRLKRVFPGLVESKLEDTWSKTSITIERDIIDKDPSVEAAGILDSAVGGRATMLIFDDVCNYRNTIAMPSLKEEIISSYKNVWLPFLEPGGKIVYIATPWTSDDLTAELRCNPEYKIYEARVGENYESPWPERFSSEYYKSLHRVLGDEAFNRAYRLSTLTLKKLPFEISLLEKHFTSKKPEKFDSIVCACDLGMSEESKTETVMVTVGLVEGKKYVLDVKKGKFSSPDVALILKELHSRYAYDAIFVESNAYQGALIEWIRASGYDLPVESLNTQGSDNYIRLVAYTLEIEMKNGLWRFVVDHFDRECKCDYCDSIKQLSEYPEGSKNDFLAALCIALRALQTFVRSSSIELYTPSLTSRTVSRDYKNRYMEV